MPRIPRSLDRMYFSIQSFSLGSSLSIRIHCFGRKLPFLRDSMMLLAIEEMFRIDSAMRMARGTLSRASVATTEASARTALRRSSLGLSPSLAGDVDGFPRTGALEKTTGAALREAGQRFVPEDAVLGRPYAVASHDHLVAKQSPRPRPAPANPPRPPRKTVSVPPWSSPRRKEKPTSIGLFCSAGDAEEAIRAVSTSALSRVVLPDPLGPMSTTTEGSRTSGLAALCRKRGRSGAVPGIRRSRTTSSRIDW